MKKIITLFSFCFSLIVLFGFNVNAKTIDTANLQFTLISIIEFGNVKYISIEISNKSDNIYSFGWEGSCNLNVETSSGTYKNNISNGKINKDTKTYRYILDAPGEIKSIYYTNILELENDSPIYDDTSLPLSETISVNLDLAITYNGILISEIVLGFILALIILIIILTIMKKGTLVITGLVLSILGIIVLLYSAYFFVIKILLIQTDVYVVLQKYWYLWIIGFVIFFIGKRMLKRNKKHQAKKALNNAKA